MKFQIIFAAIFAFAAVSAKKFFDINAQTAKLSNFAKSDGTAIAVNGSLFGSANALVNSCATNCNDVDQYQRNY